jgi:hypothetical protein
MCKTEEIQSQWACGRIKKRGTSHTKTPAVAADEKTQKPQAGGDDLKEQAGAPETRQGTKPNHNKTSSRGR